MKMGGMERVLSLLANFAAEEGFDVHIICLIDKIIAYDLDERINVHGPDRPYKKGFGNKLKTVFFLRNTLQKIHPDTALCFSEAFNPVAIMAAKLAGYPIYISDRSNPYKKLGKGKELFRKYTYPLAEGMIAQTELAKGVALDKKYNNNIVVIPNPLRAIDDSIPKKYGKNIVTVGRLVSTKNLDELIRVFGEIDNKEWQLHILGDGDQKEHLEKTIANLNLGNRVKLMGAVKNVDAYFAEASVFAFPSLSEGFPNALSEAMAFPLPCIAYDCPAGPADIIKDGDNGFLIPMKDTTTFKDKLETLMDSEMHRNKFIEGSHGYRQKYSAERIVNQFLDFILA